MMNKYNRKSRMRQILKWLSLSLIIILAYIISTTGGADKAKPLLLIPIVICISLSENEIVAGIIGGLCGLLIDISCDKLVGSNAIFMLITGVLTSLLFLHVMRKNIMNIIFLTFMASIIHGAFDIFLFFTMWNYENVGTVVKGLTIPSIIFTVIASPIIYLIVNFITAKFAEPEVLVIEEKGSNDYRNKY